LEKSEEEAAKKVKMFFNILLRRNWHWEQMKEIFC